MNRMEKRIIEEYWLKKLSTTIQPVYLPLRFNNVNKEAIRKQIRLPFPPGIEERLRKTGEKSDLALFLLFFSGVNILLKKYCGINDLLVGTMSVNKESMQDGLLFCRTTIADELSLREALNAVKDSVLEAFTYSEYSFEEIKKVLVKEKELVLPDIYTVACIYSGLQNHSNVLEKFEILVVLSESQHRLELVIEYDTNKYHSEMMDLFAHNVIDFFGRLKNNLDMPVSGISVLCEDERRLLDGFNRTYTDYPKHRTLQELFEEQVSRNPGQTALVFYDKTVTYDQLNIKANQLARFLRRRGVTANDIVAIIMDKSIEMIVAVIGILKAGGAYLPIDPNTPEQRLVTMLDDASPRLIVTKSDMIQLKNPVPEIIYLDKTANSIDQEESGNPDIINTSSDLAYIMYTSGSTGIPKGSMVCHYNVTRVVRNTNYMEIKPGDRLLLVSNYSFDGSIVDLFGSLLNGATLVLITDEDVFDLSNLVAIIKDMRISLFFITTAYFNKLVNYHLDCLENVRKIIIGGEKASYYHIRKSFNYLGKGRVVNGYGPTETTVFATAYVVDALYSEFRTIPIGKPLSNSEIYILDKHYSMQPIGVPGEVFIGGDGVSKGYLNNPGLTKEKFIESPFSKDAVLYKTGDYAMWMPDGNIMFLERMDNQVKFRGYRIELGEIESHLLHQEFIKDAVVLFKGEEEHRAIHAYIVTEKNCDINDLKKSLGKVLPHYMIPRYFIQLDELPHTPNGKVDKDALLVMESDTFSGPEVEEPLGGTETILVKIWKEILSLKQVSVNDNFFELGGYSLDAINLSSRIEKELKVKIKIANLFKYPTIRELAAIIENSIKTSSPVIHPAGTKEYYPLSSQQKRLFSLQQINTSGTVYNMPQVFIVKGNIRLDKLKFAFNQLIAKHQAFRTSFSLIAHEPVQKISDSFEFTIGYEEKMDADIKTCIENFISPFDLSAAPLLRITLTKIRANEYYLLLDMHHIIADGISMGILMKDFIDAYSGKTLEKLRIQYKDYSVWQNSVEMQERMAMQEGYWKNIFYHDVPLMQFPSDFPRPGIQDTAGARYRFHCGEEITMHLKRVCKDCDVTLFMLLLSVYKVLLQKYTGQDDIVVGTPVSGRNYTDLKEIVGYFVNTLALRSEPEDRKAFKEYLAEVRKIVLDAFDNQEYQFEDVCEIAGIARDVSHHPMFDTLFVFEHWDLREFEIEDVSFRQYDLDSDTSKFDITFVISEKDNSLFITVEYCTALFRSATIEALVHHYKRLLYRITGEPDIRIGDIDLFSEQEKKAMLASYGFLGKDIYLNGEYGSLPVLEKALLSNPAIEDCAVVFDKQKGLSVYYTLHKKISYYEINAYLEEHLPRNYFPLTYIFVSRIPRNRSGKINFRQLESEAVINSGDIDKLDKHFRQLDIDDYAIFQTFEYNKPPVHAKLWCMKRIGGIEETSTRESDPAGSPEEVSETDAPPALVHGA
ncbi:MAG: amino acid adenylation domain-containing protein, partial [Spirochaetales bacterium]|nr:amino acid adenylation domain-containing protein [Spirochaetales bacterium]